MMASGFAALDTMFPSLEGQTTEQKLQTMTDYLYQLLEHLRYTLRNLDDENMNAAFLKKISGAAGAEIEVELDAIRLRVTNAEGEIATLELTADGLSTRVTDAEGDISALEQTATSLGSRVTDAEGDISALEQTATSLGTRVTDAEGNISALQQTATSLGTRMTSAEGDISTLQQTATSLTTRMGTAEGDISALEQTATSLGTRVTNAEGDISALEQTASGLSSRVTSAEGDISTLQQTADDIKAQVTDGQGNYTVLNLKSDGLHVGNAAGTSTISGGSITANSITLNQLGADVTGSFGDDNPDYIKNTYIDFRQVQSPAVYAGDFYGGKYHDADGASTLDITSASTWWRLLFGDSSGSGLADTSFAIDADPIAGSAKLYLAGKHVMNMAFSVNDNVLNLEVPLWLPTALRLGNSGTNWGSTLPTGLTAADVGRVFFQI